MSLDHLGRTIELVIWLGGAFAVIARVMKGKA